MNQLMKTKKKPNSPEEEKEWWDKLKKLSYDDDVVGFYKTYAKYLEWNNVISEQRQALHLMAIKAAQMLEAK